jgi:hypothetical protein
MNYLANCRASGIGLQFTLEVLQVEYLDVVVFRDQKHVPVILAKLDLAEPGSLYCQQSLAGISNVPENDLLGVVSHQKILIVGRKSEVFRLFDSARKTDRDAYVLEVVTNVPAD